MIDRLVREQVAATGERLVQVLEASRRELVELELREDPLAEEVEEAPPVELVTADRVALHLLLGVEDHQRADAGRELGGAWTPRDLDRLGVVEVHLRQSDVVGVDDETLDAVHLLADDEERRLDDGLLAESGVLGRRLPRVAAEDDRRDREGDGEEDVEEPEPPPSLGRLAH